MVLFQTSFSYLVLTMVFWSPFRQFRIQCQLILIEFPMSWVSFNFKICIVKIPIDNQASIIEWKQVLRCQLNQALDRVDGRLVYAILVLNYIACSFEIKMAISVLSFLTHGPLLLKFFFFFLVDSIAHLR